MAQLYLQNILLPGEQVRHHAKVHYVLYVPGLLMIGFSYMLLYVVPDVLWDMGLVDYDAWSKTNNTLKFIGATLFMTGIAMVLRAWLRIYSTELLITDIRILVKIGISSATTAEIDRNRISSVVVTKPFWGRILNYGWVSILGFSGNITGLPVLANPHEIQKHIYSRQ